MKVLEITGEDYTPAYKRTEITDKLHETFGFNTDFKIMTQKNIKIFCISFYDRTHQKSHFTIILKWDF